MCLCGVCTVCVSECVFVSVSVSTSENSVLTITL